MVRIVAALRPLHLLPGGHHRAVHINRESAQPGAPNGGSRQLRIQFLHPRQMMRAKLAQPSPHRARRRQPRQSAEALHDGIAFQIQEMAHPAAATDHQGQQQQHHRRDAEVGAWHVRIEIAAQLLHQPDGAHVAPQELQPGIRGQPRMAESELQICVDPAPQISFS